MSHFRSHVHPSFHGGKNNCEQVTDEYLTCTICEVPGFRQPKILLCGHTFCCQCLENYVAGSTSFNCQLCGKLMTLPKGGVQCLNDNIFVDAQVDNLLRRHNKANGRDDSFYNITRYE